jgi:hypothetical protein
MASVVIARERLSQRTRRKAARSTQPLSLHRYTGRSHNRDSASVGGVLQRGRKFRRCRTRAGRSGCP